MLAAQASIRRASRSIRSPRAALPVARPPTPALPWCGGLEDSCRTPGWARPAAGRVGCARCVSSTARLGQVAQAKPTVCPTSLALPRRELTFPSLPCSYPTSPASPPNESATSPSSLTSTYVFSFPSHPPLSTDSSFPPSFTACSTANPPSPTECSK